MCEDMSSLCDFTSNEETSIKQEYLVLKEWLDKHKDKQ